MQIGSTKDGNLSFGRLTPPLILEHILRASVGLVNAAFLSHISRSAVSAVNISNQYIGFFQMLATAVAMASVVCFNQAVGMQNRKNMDKFAAVAFFSNAAMGLLSGLLFLFFSESFLSIMTFETDEIRIMAVTYMRVVGSSMILQCMQIALGSISRSSGLPRAPLIVSLLTNGINILGCYMVVNRVILTNWVPIAGVAACNVFAQLCGLILSAFLLRFTSVRITWKAIVPFPYKEVRLALSIGIPSALNNVAYSLSQIITSSIISQTSQLMLDAKTYISSIVNYIAMVGMAYSESAIIMIGTRIGAGDIDGANKIRARGTRIALLSNAVFSILLLLTYRYIFIWVYGTNADISKIMDIASIILVIDLVAEIGRALNNSLSGALQAAGDVAYQLIVNQTSGWLIAIGGAYLLGIVFGWELYGIWIAFALDECTRGLLLLYRWRSQKWVGKARQRTETIAQT
ncbi:MAG: MATE family efflux transporter [Christensenellales bacterium]|jgi:putative MATE family efflux protein